MAETTQEIYWWLLILGTLIALFGWVIYWTGVYVIGAFVSGGVGLVAGYVIAISMARPEAKPELMIFGTIAGVVLGLILVRSLRDHFYLLLGAMFGAPLGWAVVSFRAIQKYEWAHSPVAPFGAIVIGAFVGGIVILVARRYVIALISALIGSVLIAASLQTENRVAVILIVVIVSMVIQSFFIRRLVSREQMQKAAAAEEAVPDEPPAAKRKKA